LSERILDLFNKAGDEHLGQTLMRLAQLATAVEQFDQAAIMTDAFAGDAALEIDATESQSEVTWIKGFDPQSAPALSDPFDDAAYTEVSQ